MQRVWKAVRSQLWALLCASFRRGPSSSGDTCLHDRFTAAAQSTPAVGSTTASFTTTIGTKTNTFGVATPVLGAYVAAAWTFSPTVSITSATNGATANTFGFPAPVCAHFVATAWTSAKQVDASVSAQERRALSIREYGWSRHAHELRARADCVRAVGHVRADCCSCGHCAVGAKNDRQAGI